MQSRGRQMRDDLSARPAWTIDFPRIFQAYFYFLQNYDAGKLEQVSVN